MRLTEYVDCLIPRGGPSLIQSIRDNATVPVIIDGDGNCHVYVDASADLDEALEDRRQREDAAARACATRPSRWSCTRPSPTRSCRGSPTLLHEHGVELVGDDERRRRVRRTSGPRPTTTSAASSSTSRCRVARRRPTSTRRSTHVNRYGTGHTEAILTRDLDAARRFTNEVDAAAVLVERVDPVHRRRGVRLRRRDRHLDAEAARARPDGPARAHDLQVRRLGRRQIRG